MFVVSCEITRKIVNPIGAMSFSSTSKDNSRSKINKDSNQEPDRASPFSILELSIQDGGSCNKNNNCGCVDAIEIVADLSRHGERRFCDVSILPTIREATPSEKERDESGDPDDAPSISRLPLVVASRYVTDPSHQEVKQLMEQAAAFESEGNEDWALVLYKKSLRIFKKE